MPSAIVAAWSDLVCCIRDNSQVAVVQERALPTEATAAGVRRDTVVRLEEFLLAER